MNELQIMGLQEMDAQEMKNENGGISIELYAYYLCASVLVNELVEGFKAGWNENKR